MVARFKACIDSHNPWDDWFLSPNNLLTDILPGGGRDVPHLPSHSSGIMAVQSLAQWPIWWHLQQTSLFSLLCCQKRSSSSTASVSWSIVGRLDQLKLLGCCWISPFLHLLVSFILNNSLSPYTISLNIIQSGTLPCHTMPDKNDSYLWAQTIHQGLNELSLPHRIIGGIRRLIVAAMHNKLETRQSTGFGKERFLQFHMEQLSPN